MRLVRHLADLPFPALEGGSVVTVGSYDGLHLGHQRLLARVRELAAAHDVPSVVMSFEPMPKEFFSAGAPPARLMRFREKFDALAEAGMRLFFCPRFNDEMRNISAADFIRRVLVHGLNVRTIVVGDDFAFARAREGNVEQLLRAGRALDYRVEQVPSVIVNGMRVSSTAIRAALGCGDLETARTLLGRPYRMSGRVVAGANIGRSLGYPTANVDLRRRQSAVMGIFAVRVHGVDGGPVDGVASVGSRPTFDGKKALLEVHLFDFDRDLYGRHIAVDFIARLRDQKKFERVEDLVAQMHIDADNARSLLKAVAA